MRWLRRLGARIPPSQLTQAVLATKASVTTIEHRYESSDEALQAMKVGSHLQADFGGFRDFLADERDSCVYEKNLGFQDQVGLRGDTGAFAHSYNTREIELICG